jgi:hypothetical protein
MLVYASEPLARESKNSGIPRTAALFRETPGVIIMAKDIEHKHKGGEVNRNQQYEDLCQLFGRYCENFDEPVYGGEFEA